jgi:hypothetical protein
MAVGVLAAVGALSLHSFLDFNLRMPSNALAFACLLGLAASPRTGESTSGRPVPALLALAFVLVSAAAGWRAWGAWQVASVETVTDPNRRIAGFDRVLPGHPYDASARRLRAAAWRDIAWQPPRWLPGRLGRAEADLRAALVWRPRWGALWTDLGWSLHLQGRQDAAAEAFRQAVALEPTHVALGQARADFLARTGDVPQALAELRRVRGVTAHFSLAEATRTATTWTRDRSMVLHLTDGSAAERQIVDDVLRTAAPR